MFYIPAECFHDTCDFVPERKGQGIDTRYSGPIMRIRMTDSGGFDSHQYVVVSRLRQRDFVQFKRTSRFNKSNSFH